jgi:hypothetical protein
MLRQLSDAQIFVGPVPLKTSRARRPDVPFVNMVSYEAVACLVSSVIDSEGVRFIAQPTATVGEGGWSTKDEYAKGATSLVGGGLVAESDTLHMNATFGEVYLRRVFLAL